MALWKKTISCSATCTTGGTYSVWPLMVHVAFQTLYSMQQPRGVTGEPCISGVAANLLHLKLLKTTQFVEILESSFTPKSSLCYDEKCNHSYCYICPRFWTTWWRKKLIEEFFHVVNFFFVWAVIHQLIRQYIFKFSQIVQVEI